MLRPWHARAAPQTNNYFAHVFAATCADEVPHDPEQLVDYADGEGRSDLFSAAGVEEASYGALCRACVHNRLEDEDLRRLRTMFARLRQADLQLEVRAAAGSQLQNRQRLLLAFGVSAAEHLDRCAPQGAGVRRDLVFEDSEQTHLPQLQRLLKSLPDQHKQVGAS